MNYREIYSFCTRSSLTKFQSMKVNLSNAAAQSWEMEGWLQELA